MLRMDWGVDGVRYALKNNEIVVIVDALRFSTAVTTAVANGFTIHPVSDRRNGEALAASLGAEMSGRPGQARYTISPQSFLGAKPGDNRQVVVFSPNGAACAKLVGDDDIVFIGCFLNARSVGRIVSITARKKARNVTVVAAGEQRAIDTGERIVYDKGAAYPVFAIEDYLASGAIISGIDIEKSAEASLCQLTYESARDQVKELLFGSFSGRYLVENNLSDDILHAVRHDLYDVVPVIRQGKITKF
ncbi:2-phosphosulfolactate phosphatase [candidate division WOR-3 bacterium]|nr:2-phosphosulfolactate phosphatase [candidate division WOR-3 bacterium]